MIVFFSCSRRFARPDAAASSMIDRVVSVARLADGRLLARLGGVSADALRYGASSAAHQRLREDRWIDPEKPVLEVKIELLRFCQE